MKAMKKVTTAIIIGGGLIGFTIAIIKLGPTIANKIKRKTTPTINLDDLPEEEPAIVWEECEEG